MLTGKNTGREKNSRQLPCHLIAWKLYQIPRACGHRFLSLLGRAPCPPLRTIACSSIATLTK